MAPPAFYFSIDSTGRFRTQSTDADRQNVNPFWQHYLLGYDTFGNMTSVRVCASSAEREGYTTPIDLATYEYEGNVYNGRLAKMTYGNGDSVSYTYDAFDRQRTAAYNDDAEICRVARQRLPVRDGVSGAERVDVAGAAQQPRKKTQTGHRNFSDSSTFAPARRIYWAPNE